MLFTDSDFRDLTSTSQERRAVRAAYRMDEEACLAERLKQASLPAEAIDRIEERARNLVRRVREDRVKSSGIDAFMHEYELSSQEGVVLMCLAEALLRIPDSETADALIKDKIGGGNWESHLGHSESLFVNASTWGLMLTGKLVKLEDAKPEFDWRSTLSRMVHRSGEPVIRQAVTQAMRVMGRQFVMGRTIEEATDRAKSAEKIGYRHSYDMLGEAARTMEDAERYFQAYAHAIEVIGKKAKGRGPIDSPGVSIKLSALHSRYEFVQRDRVMAELYPKLMDLAQMAKAQDIGLCVDAEEADRLDISMDVIKAASGDASLKGWDGFGLAVQAYQKRAAPLIDWLEDVAGRTNRRLMVRLVKGAYWDTEVKRAQEMGEDGYPVFTRKVTTDVSYLACARKLLDGKQAFYPCFATHNAHSVAAVIEMAGNRNDYEFQRLHGMGDALYEQIVGKDKLGLNCRIYAPVGSHEDLLAYLVRRLLENGANTSFVNRIVDEKQPLAAIVADPIAAARSLRQAAHPSIPVPRRLYGDGRDNAQGMDVTDVAKLEPLRAAMMATLEENWWAGPIVGGRPRDVLTGRVVHGPADNGKPIGRVLDATADDAMTALDRAHRARHAWDRTPAKQRADILRRIADLYEENMPRLMAFAVREAGKSIPDAIAEVREAVDFLRYYADKAEEDFSGPTVLPGPTGESNSISLHGRGVFLCISPWNFPLAIFTGQVAAALAAGNCVLAKPAEQTPIIAYEAVRLMHRAGLPDDVLSLLPGDGPTIGNALLPDPRIAGVAFTGSTDTARIINKALANREGPIAPLIAETGGQNAMIVDSSALPEQVTRDVLISAFQSAGQRCSALRVLFVQQDIADKLTKMIAGAMKELRIGDPSLLATDVGPVIDDEAKAMLSKHAERMDRDAKLIYRTPMPENCAKGTFFAPCAYEIPSLDVLEREVFGPVLHVIRYKSTELDKVIDAINGTGYGLTAAVHSRVEATVNHIVDRLEVGNAYVNRNQIGAIVGVQPFGGEGLSGTGPKAGGPRYLHRFATERVISVDTTAAGGNASLMSMEDA